jgi:hypothetical protein
MARSAGAGVNASATPLPTTTTRASSTPAHSTISRREYSETVKIRAA